MLKLIVVDDEKFMLETISTIIDWKNYGIKIIGLCKNGMEAYDMILDECPDIVLTDIRMPGMSGLELIKKIRQTDIDTCFIVLSGYGEFEYAKEAMKYGVKNYILKPCSESQILDAIEQCKKDYHTLLSNKEIKKSTFERQKNINHNIISTIINDYVCQNISLIQNGENYQAFIDFQSTSYRLYYVYYLEFDHLDKYLKLLKSFFEDFTPNIIIYGVYVNNTLLLFFEDKLMDQSFEQFTSKIRFNSQHVELEYESIIYQSLYMLMENILKKLKRFGVIYYINNFHAQSICNYNVIIAKMHKLYQTSRYENSYHIEEFIDMIQDISDIDFLKQFTSSLLLKLNASISALSTYELTEWLMEFDNENAISSCKELVSEKLRSILSTTKNQVKNGSIVFEIYQYIEDHISDSNITLKYISENYLFLNVDYVSRKFLKETGEKFSAYLTRKRIDTAIKTFQRQPSISIQTVAELVGCGNNPQYFSMLFKKQTGKTPSAYIASLRGKI